MAIPFALWASRRVPAGAGVKEDEAEGMGKGGEKEKVQAGAEAEEGAREQGKSTVSPPLSEARSSGRKWTGKAWGSRQELS
jgi:hypothetical protein